MMNLRAALLSSRAPASTHESGAGARASIPLALLLAGLMTNCGVDRPLCTRGPYVDDTVAVAEPDFQSFAHDDGELDETECAALCDCLMWQPQSAPPTRDGLDGGAADAASRDSGPSGPQCPAVSARFRTFWRPCTYRGPAAGYRLVRCSGQRSDALACSEGLGS